MSGSNVLVHFLNGEWTVWLGDVNRGNFETQETALAFARRLASRHNSRLWLQVGRYPPKLVWSPGEDI